MYCKLYHNFIISLWNYFWNNFQVFKSRKHDSNAIYAQLLASKELDKQELIAFIDGIAGGELYKASESSEKLKSTKNSKKCSEECKKECELNADKKTCNEACKMACSKNKEA